MNYNAVVDRISKAEWSECLQQFADATIYQTWSYGAVRWGEGNLSHLVLRRNGEMVALAQAVIKKIPLLNAGVAYIPWGPVWKRNGEERNPEDMGRSVRALREEYVSKRGLLLRMTPMEIEGESGQLVADLEVEGFRKTAVPYRTLFIDLMPPMEETYRGLARRWRRAIKSANQYMINVVEGTGDELFEAFKSLYREMLERKRFVPSIDVDEFQDIQKDLPDPLKMKIMLGEFKGKTVSALIASRIGERGVGLLGATGTVGLNLGSFHLLNWKMMEWLKSSGAAYYDFGGYDPEKNPGTASFKEGLPAKIVTHIGQYEACESAVSASVVKYGSRSKEVYQKARIGLNDFRTAIRNRYRSSGAKTESA